MAAFRGRALACLVIVLGVIAPGCARGDRPTPTAAGVPEALAPVAPVDPALATATDREIARHQARLQRDVADPAARLGLARAFLQKVRETGDSTYYRRAELILDDLGRAAPDDPSILVARGDLALGRHDFRTALELGRRAVGRAPGNAAALGVVVDAANELGRYDEALEATQRMADAKPDLPSLARVSYARELRGDLDGAVAAMAQAATAGTGSGEPVAATLVLLGNLLVTNGDLPGAERAYAAAEQAFPASPLPEAGRARLAVARGDAAAAAALLAGVVKVLPTVEHVVAYGDVLTALGRTAEAEEQYGLVRAIARLDAGSGVAVDLEMALFDADHAPGKQAVAAARRAVKARPGLYARDALAWSLFTAGKADQAWKEARRAVALGTRDPSVRFHAAAIAERVGERAAAAEHLRVVVSTNPRFSARLAPQVTQLAARLGLAA